MTLHLQLSDDEPLSRSKTGTIWGRIYFQIGHESFPDAGWSDLTVVFTTAWLDALTNVAKGMTDATTIFFLDGPASVRVSRLNPEYVRLEFIHKENLKHSVDVHLKALVRDAVSAGHKLLTICKSHGWTEDRDYRKLVDSVNRCREIPSV